eukprot:2585329-Prymnesium_polylepis.1
MTVMPASNAAAVNASALGPLNASCALTRAALVIDDIVRKNMGYDSPLLSSGLPDDGETMGTLAADATCAAVTDAVLQPAPTMALTPAPLKASRISASAPQVIGHAVALVVDLAQRLVHAWAWAPTYHGVAIRTGVKHGKQHTQPHRRHARRCCLRRLA